MYSYAEDRYTGFWWGNMRKIDHLEDLGVDGRIILKLIFKKCNGGGGMDWIDLAQDSERWRDLVNAVLNLRVS
jgi:hypothetical protein